MPLQPLSYPPIIRTESGNGEERAAQIDRIQARLDRLRRSAEQITTELAAVTKDVENLSAPEAPALSRAPTKASN